MMVSHERIAIIKTNIIWSDSIQVWLLKYNRNKQAGSNETLSTCEQWPPKQRLTSKKRPLTKTASSFDTVNITSFSKDHLSIKITFLGASRVVSVYNIYCTMFQTTICQRLRCQGVCIVVEMQWPNLDMPECLHCCLDTVTQFRYVSVCIVV